MDDVMGKSAENNLLDKRLVLPLVANELCPEITALYRKSLSLEKRLEDKLKRKMIIYHQEVNQSLIETGRLRVFVKTQFFVDYAASSVIAVNGKPCWNWVGSKKVEIKGSLLNYGKMIEPKFTTYFESIVVQLKNDSIQQPAYLKWERNPSIREDEQDGVALKLDGLSPVTCKLVLTPRIALQRFHLDQRLMFLPGAKKVENKADIYKMLWAYVKANSLQDPRNCMIINCDHYLEMLFRQKQISFRDIPRKLKELMKSAEQTVITCTIRFDEATAETMEYFDIDVLMKSQWKQDLAIRLPTFAAQKPRTRISELEKRIVACRRGLCTISHRFKFFTLCHKDMRKFMSTWMSSLNCITRELSPENSTEPPLSEVERRAAFYAVHPWIHEGVTRYVSRTSTNQNSGDK